MNGTSFDAFARRAVATVSRRASLSALGAAALGVIASSDRVEAGSNCGKKCNKRCQAQSPTCAAAASTRCLNNDACLSKCLGCCVNLRNCEQSEVSAAVTCLMDCAH
jgi:hypothetical protein